jgi:hypothetical protein
MNIVIYSVWHPVTNILMDIPGEVRGLNAILGCYPYWHTCGRIWPCKSLDINPYALLLLGFMNGRKNELFPEKPVWLMEPWYHFPVLTGYTEDMCHQMVTTIQVHQLYIVWQNGNRIGYVCC